MCVCVYLAWTSLCAAAFLLLHSCVSCSVQVAPQYISSICLRVFLCWAWWKCFLFIFWDHQPTFIRGMRQRHVVPRKPLVSGNNYSVSCWFSILFYLFCQLVQASRGLNLIFCVLLALFNKNNQKRTFAIGEKTIVIHTKTSSEEQAGCPARRTGAGVVCMHDLLIVRGLSRKRKRITGCSKQFDVVSPQISS